MSSLFEMQVINHEEKLRQAMLNSDVAALNDLLADDLIFTSHLGQFLNKQDDLEAHESGIVKIIEIVPSEQHIKVLEGAAIVSVKVHMLGSIGGSTSEGDFRFTRIWLRKPNEKWQVIAAHSSVVA